MLVIVALLVLVLDFASKASERSRQRKESETAAKTEQELSIALYRLSEIYDLLVHRQWKGRKLLIDDLIQASLPFLQSRMKLV